MRVNVPSFLDFLHYSSSFPRFSGFGFPSSFLLGGLIYFNDCTNFSNSGGELTLFRKPSHFFYASSEVSYLRKSSNTKVLVIYTLRVVGMAILGESIPLGLFKM